MPGHGAPPPPPHPDDAHLVPIQSVRDSYVAESGARGEYDRDRDRDRERERDRDYERHQQPPPPEGEWRHRPAPPPSPPRDLPSVAAVLGERKRKRSSEPTWG